MQIVGERKRREVRWAVEIEAVEVVQVRVLRGALLGDLAKHLTDDRQCELANGDLGWVAGGAEEHSALGQGVHVERARAGRVLVDRAIHW